MGDVLVHLHPDFSDELDNVLRSWNQVQSTLVFHGIRPAVEQEARLLSPGAISLNDALLLADRIRHDASTTRRDASIAIFTEKRIHDGKYYQLFFGGNSGCAAISLDFTRKLFADAAEKSNYIFRTILSNLLSYVAQEEGFNTHDDTRGCVLDFCNHMPDIVKGITRGPKFCEDHNREIGKRRKGFLLDLAGVIRNTEELAQQDAAVSRKVASFDRPADVGIVIALTEEFRVIFPRIQSHAKPSYMEDVNQYYFVFEIENGKEPYRCAATCIGGMGIDRAALAADRLMASFRPATIVNIGIAGSMEKNVLAGDVIVAEQSNNYLANAKALDGKYTATLEFQLSGDPYKSTAAYVSHVQNLEFVHVDAMRRWRQACSEKWNNDTSKKTLSRILKQKMVATDSRKQECCPNIHTGSIASGAIVGASGLFVDWLKEKSDRKYLAIEMESVGVLAAAHTRPTDTLIIRGISDFSDERKKAMESEFNGTLRRYGMNNAVELLWTLIELQLLKRAHQHD